MHARTLLAATTLLLMNSTAWCQGAAPEAVQAPATAPPAAVSPPAGAPPADASPDAAQGASPSTQTSPTPAPAAQSQGDAPAAKGNNDLPEVQVIQKPQEAEAPKPTPEKKPADVADDAPGDVAPAAKPRKKKVAATPQKPAAKPNPAVAAPVPQSAEDVTPVAAGEPLSAPPGTLIVSDDPFAPITTTTQREIVAKQGQTITDTLATKPGIIGSTFAPGANRPIVRGLDNNRVRVQEGGIGTHDVSTLSEDHAIPVDPYAAERVEVIRGPETLRYGGQAVGGVVSIENDRVPSFIPRGGFSGAITGGLSSVDDGEDGAFKATAGANGMAVHADGFKRQAEDYRTPRGIQENSYVDSQGGSAGASLVGPDGFIGVAFARVESNYGIPAEEAHIELEQDKILSRGEWRIQGTTIEAIRFWFGASDYAHNEVAEDGEIGSRFTNREQEFRAEIDQHPISTALGELSGTWGGQWGHGNLRGQSFEGSSLLEPAETNRIAGFVFQTLGLTDQLKVLGAARIESARIDGTGLLDFSDPSNLILFTGEKSYTPVSFSGGLAYDFAPGLTGRLTGQYVERAPEAPELFSQGLHEATGTFEIGNPNLEKEKARTIEVGLKQAGGDLRFDASAYYTQFDGFISKDLTGVQCGDTIDTCGVEDELDQLRFEQRDARFYGVEIAAQYDIAPIWTGVWGVEGQYDFVNARFNDGENVPRIPPHRLGGGLYYRDANWFARTAVLHAFDQDRIAFVETPTKGYTLISAELSYTALLPASGALAPEYTIGIKGENLADDEVRNHASFKKDEVLQPGANVRVFGTVKF